MLLRAILLSITLDFDLDFSLIMSQHGNYNLLVEKWQELSYADSIKLLFLDKSKIGF